MSTETEWFEGRKEEETRPTILPALIWLGIIVCVLFIAAGLSGCATVKEVPKSPRQDICMVQDLGQTDSGIPVVALYCITPEEFAASQK